MFDLFAGTNQIRVHSNHKTFRIATASEIEVITNVETCMAYLHLFLVNLSKLHLSGPGIIQVSVFLAMTILLKNILQEWQTASAPYNL